ncbi:TPA: phosphorylcholine transferase LicD [Enterococcus faecalis]
MEQTTQTQLVEIHQVVLRMSKYFVAFCEEHNLTCYFCGGGCIGAIRSQGFIPWDDDLDFFMPRPDYEKLKVLWPKYADTERYPLLVASKTYNDHNSFMTIRDAQTTFIKTYQDGLAIPHGIPIDIFPLDGAPKGNFQRKKQKIWALIYALFCSQVVPEKHGGILATGSRVLLNIFPSKKVRYHIWRFAEKRMTKYSFGSTPYVTELCVGPRYMGNIYHLEDFKSAIFVPFEDTKMPIPVGYKRYLTEVFGDYMQLPPEEDRQPHHEALIVDTKKSYTEYLKK